jgi:hypothetical protein
MTDKEWAEKIAEIEGLRFQLIHNVMPMDEREKLRQHLKTFLHRLARRDMP